VPGYWIELQGVGGECGDADAAAEHRGVAAVWRGGDAAGASACADNISAGAGGVHEKTRSKRVVVKASVGMDRFGREPVSALASSGVDEACVERQGIVVLDLADGAGVAIAPHGVAAQVMAEVFLLPIAEARVTRVDLGVVLREIVEGVAVGIEHVLEGVLEHDEGRGLDDVLGGVYLIVLGTVTENPEVDALSAEIGDTQIGVAQCLGLFVVEKDYFVDAEVQVHYF